MPYNHIVATHGHRSLPNRIAFSGHIMRTYGKRGCHFIGVHYEVGQNEIYVSISVNHATPL